MADEEHLNVLKQGVDAWNAWRIVNSRVVPELSGAVLTHWDLSGINLREANLQVAVLDRSD
ncbi:MAG: pentapeptide repeat-containing protein [Acidobacteriia bacterium]|nr:pentapeptide repeat-containing protein [Terriglobia bacterium]